MWIGDPCLWHKGVGETLSVVTPYRAVIPIISHWISHSRFLAYTMWSSAPHIFFSLFFFPWHLLHYFICLFPPGLVTSKLWEMNNDLGTYKVPDLRSQEGPQTKDHKKAQLLQISFCYTLRRKRKQIKQRHTSQKKHHLQWRTQGRPSWRHWKQTKNCKDQGQKREARRRPWVVLENRNTIQDLVEESIYCLR